MSSLVIDFKTDGKVVALHMDSFDLGFLGRKATKRQTDIIFDEDSQLWNLEYIKEDGSHFCDEALRGFSSYESARVAEVDWLNTCLLTQLDPTDQLAMLLMASLRTPS